MIANTPEAHAAQIIENPDYYTVVRFKGRGQYERLEFDTFHEAEMNALGDRRAMIYAVKGGRDCLLNEKGEPAVGVRK